jgi:Flp pilus assembly protein TadD
MNQPFRSLMAAALALCLGAGAAFAAGTDDTPAAKQDPNFVEAKKNVEAGKYEAAVPLLEQSVASAPNNADAWNYLGYSLRKSGRKEEALTMYQKALALEPKHRGANEYLGELYLEMGELAKAKERLKVLDGACFFGCDEYTDLKEAIKAYEAKTGS